MSYGILLAVAALGLFVEYWYLTLPVTVFLIFIAIYISNAKRKAFEDAQALALAKKEQKAAEKRRRREEEHRRIRSAKEYERAENARLKEIQRIHLTAVKQLTQLSKAIIEPTSLNYLLSNLATAREQFSRIDFSILNQQEQSKYHILARKLKMSDTEIINNYISESFNELCSSAIAYKALEDFYKETHNFFYKLDRASYLLPVGSVEYIQELKRNVGVFYHDD